MFSKPIEVKNQNELESFLKEHGIEGFKKTLQVYKGRNACFHVTIIGQITDEVLRTTIPPLKRELSEDEMIIKKTSHTSHYLVSGNPYFFTTTRRKISEILNFPKDSTLEALCLVKTYTEYKPKHFAKGVSEGEIIIEEVWIDIYLK